MQAAPEDPDEPPVVEFITPDAEEIVSGTVVIETSASDDHGIGFVEFIVDGVTKAVEIREPYSIEWDTSLETDGAHTLQVIAIDSSAQTSSQEITVVVDNSPPELRLLSPEAGQSASGVEQVIVEANDEYAGTAHVELFIDGDSDGMDSNGSDGWELPWDTRRLANGPHHLKVRAVDRTGMESEVGMMVNVANAESPAMHVSDIDAWTMKLWWKNEAALVLVQVTDDHGAPVAGALVSGAFIAGGKLFDKSCVTNESGLCAVYSVRLPRRDGNARFTVMSVEHEAYRYDPSANSDPDGDSDGTTIVFGR